MTLAALAAMTLASCGGGVGGSLKLTDNATFGKYPSICYEFRKAENALYESEWSAMLEKGEYDEAIYAKYEAKREQLKQKVTPLGPAELTKIDGRAVPFEFYHEDDRFDVSSVTVNAGQSEKSQVDGPLALTINLVAKRDVEAKTVGFGRIVAQEMYLLMFNSVPECIYKTEIQPMNRKQVSAGDECSVTIDINCMRINLTDFRTIAFADQEQFRSWEMPEAQGQWKEYKHDEL